MRSAGIPQWLTAVATVVCATGCWASWRAETDESPDGDGGRPDAADDGAHDAADADAREDADSEAEADAPAIETWAVTLESLGLDDDVLDLTETTDGGIVVLGHAYSTADGFDGSGAWVVKLDAERNVVWSKLVGSAGPAYAGAIAPAPNGGVVLAGAKHYSSAGLTAWVVRLDRDGVIVAEREWDRSLDGDAWRVVPLPDGGFVVGGFVEDEDAHSRDRAPWVARLDADLNLLWQRSYPPGFEGILSASCAANGDLLVAAHREYLHPRAMWLARLDGSGGIVWQREVTSSERVGSWATVAEMNDGDVVVVTDATDVGTLLLRFDADGNLRWQETVGGPGEASGRDLVPGVGGEAILGGSEHLSGDEESEKPWLVAFAPDGSIAWQRSLTVGTGYDARALGRALDGSLLVLSSAYNQPSWLMKLRPDGTFDGSCPLLVDATGVPVAGAVTVSESDYGFEEIAVVSSPGAPLSAELSCTVEQVCPP